MIKLLDCTLRDGGYINDWRFGHGAIADMVERLEDTNVDIIELGFLKDEPYSQDRTIFNDMGQVSGLMPHKKQGVKYAVMTEVVNPIPLDMLSHRTAESADIIRVIIWKTKHDAYGNVVDALEEGYEYCRGIIEKGYKLCVQPARVDQYSDEEFVAMLEKFQRLNPMAVYVVDSWGTRTTEQIMHYVRLADETLDKGIAVGYHGHNNLMQALGTAVDFVHLNLERDQIVDASIYGIGRGAGNLNLELIAKYLNEHMGKGYSISPMLEIFESYIRDIYETHPWGYSIAYYLTAMYNCNPNYGEYYGLEQKMSSVEMERIFSLLSSEDKVLFSRAKADYYRKNSV